jgi:hypothetical protein
MPTKPAALIRERPPGNGIRDARLEYDLHRPHVFVRGRIYALEAFVVSFELVCDFPHRELP